MRARRCSANAPTPLRCQDPTSDLRVESAGVGVWDPYEREGEFGKLFDTTPTFPYVLGS
jgi:hypothetical protein